jgi:hypothetical protein
MARTGNGVKDFEGLLSLQGVGPRTVQSLALVSEVIHGSPTRFKDPARFSFAHGGKDGHPFPVPTRVYDETIIHLNLRYRKAKIGENDKADAIRKLHGSQQMQKRILYRTSNFGALIQKERDESWKIRRQNCFR